MFKVGSFKTVSVLLFLLQSIVIMWIKKIKLISGKTQEKTKTFWQKCLVHIHVMKEPIEMTETGDNIAQDSRHWVEGKIKTFHIRAVFSQLSDSENPTTDYFFFTFLFSCGI